MGIHFFCLPPVRLSWPACWAVMLLLFLQVMQPFSAQASAPEGDDDAAYKIYLWHAATKRAGEGKLTYHFEVMKFEGREYRDIVLTTNAGEVCIRSVGGPGYNRNVSFTLTATPLRELHIKAAKDADGEDILERLDADLTKAMGSDFKKGVWPVVVAKPAKNVRPDPRLKGKILSVTLAPAIPAMQQTGVFVFTVEGEEGMPPLDTMMIGLGEAKETWRRRELA